MTVMRAWTLDDIQWVRSRYVDVGIDDALDIPWEFVAEEAVKVLRHYLDLELRGLEIQPHDLQRHLIAPAEDEPWRPKTYRYRWWPDVHAIRVEGAGAAHGQEWQVRDVGESIRIVTPRRTSMKAFTDLPALDAVSTSSLTLNLTGWDPNTRVWIYEPR